MSISGTLYAINRRYASPPATFIQPNLFTTQQCFYTIQYMCTHKRKTVTCVHQSLNLDYIDLPMIIALFCKQNLKIVYSRSFHDVHVRVRLTGHHENINKPQHFYVSKLLPSDILIKTWSHSLTYVPYNFLHSNRTCLKFHLILRYINHG